MPARRRSSADPSGTAAPALARPTSTISSPVAKGSSVPAWTDPHPALTTAHATALTTAHATALTTAHATALTTAHAAALTTAHAAALTTAHGAAFTSAETAAHTRDHVVRRHPRRLVVQDDPVHARAG